MIFYKIRHKETGKFYKPVQGYSWEKTNLSPTGKIYSRKPTLKQLRHGYHMLINNEPVFIAPKAFTESEFEKIENHFEIVEYEMMEKVKSEKAEGE